VTSADPSLRGAQATQPEGDFVAPGRISVPVHGATTLKLGLQRHLMKLAGIEKSDL
jgi:hypothetical protein